MLNEIILAAMLAQAPAQEPIERCQTVAGMQKTLADRYGEVASQILQISDTAILVVYGNPVTGTWTITQDDASGESCIQAAGTGIYAVRPKAEQRDS